MAVPNEDNFSLQDVRDEIENNGGALSIGLLECFANAKDVGFDSRYKGDKNNLLNFRNYQHIVNILKLQAGAISSYHQDHYDYTKIFTITNFSDINTLTIEYNAVFWNYSSGETVTVSPIFGEHPNIVLSTGNMVQEVTFNFNPNLIDGFFRAGVYGNVNNVNYHEPLRDKGYVLRMFLKNANIDGVPNPNYLVIREGYIPG